MDYSYGFPLYESLEEAQNYDKNSGFYRFIKDSMKSNSEGFPPGFENMVLANANAVLVYKNILKNYVPYIMMYLDGFEDLEVIVPSTDDTVFNALHLSGFDPCYNIPKQFATLVSMQISLYFKNGIKNKLFYSDMNNYEALEGDVANNTNIYINISPTPSYKNANILMNKIFIYYG